MAGHSSSRSDELSMSGYGSMTKCPEVCTEDLLRSPRRKRVLRLEQENRPAGGLRQAMSIKGVHHRPRGDNRAGKVLGAQYASAECKEHR